MVENSVQSIQHNMLLVNCWLTILDPTKQKTITLWYPYNMKWRRKKTLSKKLYTLFYDVESPHFYLANDVLAVATVVSVVTLILETVPALKMYESLFLTVEYIVLVLFVCEYVGRVVATKGR